MLNSAGLICFISSLIARRSGKRGLGIGLSTTGLALATGGAYLGGELVFTHYVHESAFRRRLQVAQTRLDEASL